MTTDRARLPELLPCPFCGGTKIDLSEGTTFRWRYIGCGECGAQMEFHSDNRFEPTDETWHDAAEAWNRRADLRREGVGDAAQMIVETPPPLTGGGWVRDRFLYEKSRQAGKTAALRRESVAPEGGWAFLPDSIPEYFDKPNIVESLAKAHPVLLVRQMANEILRLRSLERPAGRVVPDEPSVDYCPEKLKPGGCQLHNLHCGYPQCNEPPAAAPTAKHPSGGAK